jgi:hypothetical protein
MSSNLGLPCPTSRSRGLLPPNDKVVTDNYRTCWTPEDVAGACWGKAQFSGQFSEQFSERLQVADYRVLDESRSLEARPIACGVLADPLDSLVQVTYGPLRDLESHRNRVGKHSSKSGPV